MDATVAARYTLTESSWTMGAVLLMCRKAWEFESPLPHSHHRLAKRERPLPLRGALSAFDDSSDDTTV